jgi:hypothetical protein
MGDVETFRQAIGGIWVAVVLIVVAMAATLLFWLRRWRSSWGQPPEDTKRLKQFAHSTAALTWTKAETVTDFEALASGLLALFQAEIDYYYNARTMSRSASARYRQFAFALGTLGLLCPLAEPLLPAGFVWISKLGYIFLACAAASLAGNELFGGTRGHVRYVTTQYRIEHLMTQFVLDWNDWKQKYVGEGTSKPTASDGITMMKAFAAACYEAIAEETREWGSAVVQAEATFGAGIQRSPARKTGN